MKNSRWTIVIVGVIAFLMLGTLVWASPTARSVHRGVDADKVDGHHAAASWAKTSLRRNRVLWADARGQLNSRAMPLAWLNKFYVNDNRREVDNRDVRPGALHPNRITGYAWTRTNDGPGSRLNADLLDGQEGEYYRDWNNLTNVPADLVPSGAVMFFNLESCPSGWHELTEARGRYLVGLTEGGRLGYTVGTALRDRENRPVGRHKHGISDPGHKHSISDPGHAHHERPRAVPGSSYGDSNGKPYYIKWSADKTGRTDTDISIKSHTTGISIGYAGSVSGTNAPYIQFLVCVKD